MSFTHLEGSSHAALLPYSCGPMRKELGGHAVVDTYKIETYADEPQSQYQSCAMTPLSTLPALHVPFDLCLDLPEAPPARLPASMELGSSSTGR